MTLLSVKPTARPEAGRKVIETREAKDSPRETSGIVIFVRRVGLVLVLACAAACSTDSSEEYASRIAADRQLKDEVFRTDRRASPILPQDIDKFLPLSYFPINEEYAVPAQLEPAAQQTQLQIPTSAGLLRNVVRIGSLAFTVKGKLMRLTAFLEDGSAQLFVPFTDLTSGTETYRAGRYLYLDPTRTGIYIVDFNTAYHPYCYYNPEYDCPFPPKENRLEVPIHAGERLRAADATVGQ